MAAVAAASGVDGECNTALDKLRMSDGALYSLPQGLRDTLKTAVLDCGSGVVTTDVLTPAQGALFAVDQTSS